jgi:ABC-type sugar transport system ATPase subunit
MKPNENVLEIKNLVKDFPGVRAVNDVSFDIKRNTVHCLVGENGAGKSTLIKILTGVYTRTSGQILLNGNENTIRTILGKQNRRGSVPCFQELNVVDQLTVEENLTLGMEDTTFGFLRKTDKINRMVRCDERNLEPSIRPTAESIDFECGTRSRSWKSPRPLPPSQILSSWMSRLPQYPKGKLRPPFQRLFRAAAREQCDRHLHFAPSG